MKYLYATKIAVVTFLLLIFTSLYFLSNNKIENEENEDPDTNYFSMRNAYYGSVPEDVKQSVKARLEDELNNKAMLQKTGAVPTWQLIGPSNTGGRIVDVVMPKGSKNIIYAASASGGIFKSNDFGVAWSPIFDASISLSMGDIELDPNNDNTIYAGTGEPNTGGGSITYDGNGIYKSTNGGASWINIGLKNVGAIGKVAVAKTNSNIIYVAAVGNIFQTSTNKGLYQSSNGGSTWKKSLFISDSTSVNDVAISPTDANIVYACAWERISRPTGRVYGGITSNLYKSINGGTSWTKLFPDDINRGKITIDIPPTNGNLAYISIANKNGTFNTIYKYDGSTFTNIKTGISAATTYTWWFGGISCHPLNDQVVYFSDFNLFRTTNGGTKWSTVAASSHVDQHSVFVNPLDTNIVIIGNDGGVYTSTNRLANITFCKIPDAQVYDFDLYKTDETFISAGFQDNNFARTSTQGISSWQTYGGGDGVQVRVDPTDKTETYSSQYLGISLGTTGIPASDRKNWKCPIRLDPVNPKIRYTGTNKVYKYNPLTAAWTALSGDLTNGAVSTNPNYGTITSLAVAQSNNQYIYSGADDGSVYFTKNGGASWSKITTGLPSLWVTFIRIDDVNPEIAYIGFSGYRYGVKDAHLYKTTNAGSTWIRINNDLPQVPVNDLIISPDNKKILALATDFGVYYTVNGGTNWSTLGVGMPIVVVSSLYYAPISKTLYAATYGRSIYKVKVGTNFSLIQSPVYSNNSSIQNNIFEEKIKVYPNPATDFIELKLPLSEKSKNITVYNSEGIKVYTESISGDVSIKRVTVNKFAKGSYVLECFNNGKFSSEKFIIK